MAVVNLMQHIAAWWIGASMIADAKTIYVNASAAGASTGSSWIDAHTELQSAIQEAVATDEIWVAQGSYYPDQGPGQSPGNRISTFTLPAGVGIYGGFTGSESALPERNPSANQTVLSGDLLQDDTEDANRLDNSYHVVDGSRADGETLLDGFTITAGNADESTSLRDYGGALIVVGASPRFQRCAFTDNRSLRDGGAVFTIYNSSGAGSNATFMGCVFEKNRGRRGGAVHHNGPSTPTYQGCTFVSNSSASEGGAAYLNSSSPVFADCGFVGNSSGTSGGAVHTSGQSSSPQFSRCSFESNTAETGGGSMFFYGGQPLLDQCQMNHNKTNGFGGSLYNSMASTRLVNCRIAGNSARDGGAVYNSHSSPTFTNCELSGNHGDYTGAVYNSGAGSAIFRNCSLVGNRSHAQAGGAIRNYTDSTPVFENCIIWNNMASGSTASPVASVHNAVSANPTFHHCIVANSGGSAGWNGQIGTNGGSNLDTDPRFLFQHDPGAAPITRNDVRLQAASPAINSGDNSVVQVSTDLAGMDRVADGVIDLGACEGHYQVRFDVLYPSFDPTGDNNSNGRSNLADYALGSDPGWSGVLGNPTTITGLSLSFLNRGNAEDFTVTYQVSEGLQAWRQLMDGVDYSDTGTTSIGDMEQVRFTLMPPEGEPKRRFFRIRFHLTQ